MRTTTPALRQARMHLIEHGECPPGAIDERLARSWRRSVAAGLQPAARSYDTEHSSGSRLNDALTRSHQLLAHSRPVMEYLFELMPNSQSMVILADQSGTLLHTTGEAAFLGKAERVALTPGASWLEQHRGTNAIGTALAEASCIEIHGAEHFFERNSFLTCAAAPIMAASGELLGIIDISGDQRTQNPHTLGLVSTAARMIENQLVINSCRHCLRVHLHARVEGIGTFAEGILVLSDEGRIVGANRNGLTQLQLVAHDLGKTRIDQVVDIRLDDLLSRARHRPDMITPVYLHNGAMLYARVYADKSVASRPAPIVAEDALARLDAGDTRWRSASDKARRIAGKPIPLLIQGESGVGKELFARAAHDSGPRRNAPFVAINCAALPENLIEAELFGYAPGAFTGAQRMGSPGRLREAHGGTLFLDEIGDMPLTMQTRLLRVLQERQVTPVGGGRAVEVDFSLICATHHNLRAESEKGLFRSDLYYRINGLTVLLPSLRERSDFKALTDRLLAELCPGADIRLAPELLEKMSRHSWPGNLRQYVSVLRTAVAMLDTHETRIEREHLPDDLLEELLPLMTAAPMPQQKLEDMSMLAIQAALKDNQGNISAAARQLGVSRQTLYRKLK
jgi:transcriptional regulator of acetoin/glycerol metabolism